MTEADLLRWARQRDSRCAGAFTRYIAGCSDFASAAVEVLDALLDNRCVVTAIEAAEIDRRDAKALAFDELLAAARDGEDINVVMQRLVAAGDDAVR